MGAGDQHLRAAGGTADLHQIHLDHLAFTQLLAGNLLVHGQHRLGGLGAGADAQAHIARPGVDAADGAGEDLVLLAVELIVDHAVLGLAQTLNDDLLAVAGGDTAELHALHGDVDDAAQLVLGGQPLGLLQRDLGAGVLHLLHDLLLDEHLQILLLLVHVHDDVLHALVIPLIGGGQRLNDLAHHKALGNTAFLFQHRQRGEDLITFHVVSPSFIVRSLCQNSTRRRTSATSFFSNRTGSAPPMSSSTAPSS